VAARHRSVRPSACCRPAVPARRLSSPPAGAGYSEGFAGNAHRFAPTGMMAAVKYLSKKSAST
jgi:hypothetical protein